MNLKFKLSETGLDGIVQSIQAASPNPVIDIHIEGNAVEVVSIPRSYKSPNKAMRDVCSSGFYRPDHPTFGGFITEIDDDGRRVKSPSNPEMGCDCTACIASRVRRGF